jgi:hypothetical protein
MFETNSTPSQQNLKQPRWDRARTTAEVINFEEAKKNQTSQREFAKKQGLPRTTLQYWLLRKATIDADPELIAFFEARLDWLFCIDS